MSRDRWTTDEYRQYLQTGKEPLEKPPVSPTCCQPGRRRTRDDIEKAWETEKRAKYGNEKITEDGITFDSKHERNVYCWLNARKERGELRWVFVHVPFRFSSGVVYWADFMTIRADGTIEAVWDAKSEVTAKNREYVIKKKLLFSEWGIRIREVMRTDYDGNGGYFSEKWENGEEP